jgi:AcrR family transcriptional regulator
MNSKKKSAAQHYHHGDLRRAIVEAALAMTKESGLASLSLREIARRIGVTTGAPYHHFKDRQSLLVEIAIEGYSELLAMLKQARDSAESAEGELPAAASAYLSFGRSHRGQYLVMFSGELVPHARGAEMLAVADACLELVRESIAAGSKLKPEDCIEAAFCAWSLLHGILMLDSNRVLRESFAEQDRLAIRGVVGIVNGISGIDSTHIYSRVPHS